MLWCIICLCALDTVLNNDEYYVACPLQSFDKWYYLVIALAIVSVVTDVFGKESRV
ncbi:MAG: hypothetical protein GX114_09955 [Clostridiales bacterium]|nr:hypothetical protein [Clostridiales bacterium]